MTLSRRIQDFVRREIAKALAQAGFVGGTLDAGRIGGAIPVQQHALWSSMHTDVDAAVTPGHGDVLTWNAVTSKWVASSGGGVSASGSWVYIAEIITGTGGATSITFPNIPGTCRHLKILAGFRGDQTTNQVTNLRINGDTNSNYH